MDIQILNIAELLLFVFMICTCIRIYRQKKQKGKISLKTLIMFLINLIFYAMVTGTNYHRTHPGESKFQAGITYNNVRIFIYSIVFCLGLAIMKKMKKLASKWIITWAILCTVFLIVMSFCEIENAYVSFSTADQAEKYYGIEKNKIDEIKENPKDVLQGTFDDVKEKINEYSKNAITKGDKGMQRRKWSIVKVNAGKEENEYRGRVKGEIEQKETKKERDNEGKVLKYR